MKKLLLLFAIVVGGMASAFAQANCTPVIGQWPDNQNPNLVHFIDSTTNANVTAWNWSFGDGTSSQQQHPSHTFNGAGTYTVCLEATIANCDSSITCISVTIDSSGNTNCNGFSITLPVNQTLNDCSDSVLVAPKVIGGAIPYTYIWSDGQTGMSAVLGVGSYTLTATDGNGCTVTDNITISCDTSGNTCPNMFGGFVTGSLANTTVQFWDSSYTSQSTVVAHHWSFGDGSGSSLQNPSHTYNSPGTYNVCHTVYDSMQCSDTYCMKITVGGGNTTGNCVTDFDHYDYNGTHYFYIDSSQWSPTANYYWSFGDNTSGTGDYVAHVYNTNGTYNVCLYYYDQSSNCPADTICKTIVVNDSTGTNCNGLSVDAGNDIHLNDCGDTATATATPFGGKAPYTYVWSDGQQGITAHLGQGVHKVYITDANGCTYSDAISITCSNPNQKVYVGGLITTGNTYPDVGEGTVWLIQVDAQGNLFAVDSTVIDSSGSYYFNNVTQGTYLVKAALNPSSSDYNDYLPTYHGNKLFWNDAQNIILTQNEWGVNIDLIKGNNPGGPGFIAGNVSKGANKTAGGGLANVEVILLDAFDSPVAYTYSDGNGDFSFDNLAYGTYTIYSEVTGKYTTTAEVTIDAQNETTTGVSVEVNDENVNVSVNEIETEAAIVSNVYPNPAANNVNVVLNMVDAGKVTVAIYTVAGQLVKTDAVQANSGSQTLNINISELPKGMYLMNVATDNNSIYNKPLIIVE